METGVRSEQGRNIVTVTKNVGDVGAGSEKSWSNVTVTKNIGAGQSRVRVRSEQNMIHDNYRLWVPRRWVRTELTVVSSQKLGV